MRRGLLTTAILVEVISTLVILYGSYLQYTTGNFPTFLAMVGAAGIAFGSLIWAKFYDGETVIELLYDRGDGDLYSSSPGSDPPGDETLALVRDTGRFLVERIGEVQYLDEGIPIYDNVREEEDLERESNIKRRLDIEY